MEDLIKRAFLHVEPIGRQVQRGEFDLVRSNGELISPENWEQVIQPGWEVKMLLWSPGDLRYDVSGAPSDMRDPVSSGPSDVVGPVSSRNPDGKEAGNIDSSILGRISGGLLKRRKKVCGSTF